MTIDYKLEFSQPQNELFFPEGPFPKFTIVRKGRRGGLTKGAANAMIEYGLCEEYEFLPKGPLLFLWGDTISANIDKYVERYFMPELRKLPQTIWKWKTQERMMRIGRATIDFRSADRPENWEGFGYHLIFLNEAGIILDDPYLYTNAVLPMLVDFPNAKIIVAGAPKGKRNKNGEHKFYELYKKALTDTVRYRTMSFTGFDNPFIARDEIHLIEEAMDSETAKQEIYGEFIDLTEKKFLYAYSEDKHVTRDLYVPNPHLNILISFDFNKDPMTCSIGQGIDIRTLKVFDCIKVPNGSTPELCDMILAKYPQFMFKMDVTGDSTGRNRTPMLEGDVNHYIIIRQKLKLKDHNLKVQTKNKELSASRILCNSILQNADITINETCKDLINDLGANVDGYGELIKDKANPLHFFDNFRYLLEAYFQDFIDKHHLYKKKSV
jgi:hypothetical protein